MSVGYTASVSSTKITRGVDILQFCMVELERIVHLCSSSMVHAQGPIGATPENLSCPQSCEYLGACAVMFLDLRTRGSTPRTIEAQATKVPPLLSPRGSELISLWPIPPRGTSWERDGQRQGVCLRLYEQVTAVRARRSVAKSAHPHQPR